MLIIYLIIGGWLAAETARVGWSDTILFCWLFWTAAGVAGFVGVG